MGLFGGGGGGPSFKFTTNNFSGTTSTFPPKDVSDKYKQVLDRARDVADNPWTNYSNDPNAFVAGFSPDQQAAQTGFYNNATSADAGLNGAFGTLSNAGQLYNSGLGYANNANYNVANNDIARISDPYYQSGMGYTQQAANAPGGYDASNPYYNTAGNYIGAAGQNTNQIGAQDVQRYLSPFQYNVINPTLELLKQSNEQSMQGALGNVIKGGGMGNDRAGVMMANLNQQNQLANAKTLGDLNSQNYQQALQTAVGQRAQNQADLQRQLLAGQSFSQMGTAAGQLRQGDLNRILQAGQQTANIGTAQRQAYETQQTQQQADLARQLAIAQYYGNAAQGISDIGKSQADINLKRQAAYADNMKNFYGASQDQQKIEQAKKDAMYNQYLQSKAYPFETTQWMIDALGALGPNFGSSTTESGSSNGWSWDPWSDPTLKTGVSKARGGYKSGGADRGSSDQPEVIGRTFDGQDIYRYSLMGGRPQIGLMADEVQKRRPDAVTNLGGHLTLNYGKATDHAAHLGHEKGANKRPDRDFLAGGGEVLDPMLFPRRQGFVPKSKGAPRGQMPAVKPSRMPLPEFLPDKPKKPGAGAQLKELAGNAHGLYQAFKGYKGDGLFNGLGNAFNTASATEAAPAVASAATAVESAAPAAASTATSDLGSIVSPFKEIFAANGGLINGYLGGGFVPNKKKRPGEEDDDSFVPSGNSPDSQPRMPVVRPDMSKLNPGGNSDSGGGQQKQQSGMDMIKGGVDMATKGIGAFKGLGALGSSATGIGSALSGMAGAGAGAGAGAAGIGGGLASLGTAAAGGLGGLSSVLSFLPFLGFLSDPKLKTGVHSRKGFSYGGPENEEDRFFANPIVEAVADGLGANPSPNSYSRSEAPPEKPIVVAQADLGTRNDAGKTVPVGSPETRAVSKPVDVGPIRREVYDSGNFDSNIGPLLKREGGYTANDAGAGASNKGINRRAHPGEDIEHMTNDRARSIYKHDYWDAIHADQLPGPVRSLAFDAAVNQGPSRAMRWAKEAGDDPAKMAELRRAHYQSLIDGQPGLYGRYANAWAGRINAELSKQGLPLIALNSRGQAHTGNAGGPEYSGGSDLPPGANTYMASASDPMERIVFPLLSAGAGALAGASNGGGGLGAVAGGLSGFGNTYAQMEDLDLKRAHTYQQMQNERERLQMERDREGRSKTDWDRQQSDRERDKSDLASPPMPTAPAGGWAPTAPNPGLGTDTKTTSPIVEAPKTAAPPTVPAPSLETPKTPAPTPPMTITPGPADPEVPVKLEGSQGGLGQPSSKPGIGGNPAENVPAENASQQIVETPKAPVQEPPKQDDAASFWRNITENQNPYALEARAKYYEQQYLTHSKNPRLQEVAQRDAELAKRYRDEASKWANTEVLTDTNGNSVINPFLQKAKNKAAFAEEENKRLGALSPAVQEAESRSTFAKEESRKLGALSPAVQEMEEEQLRRQEKVKADMELVPYTPDNSPTQMIPKSRALEIMKQNPDKPFISTRNPADEESAKEVRKRVEELGVKFIERPAYVQQLQAMTTILSKTQTGKFSKDTAEIVNALESIGFNVPKEIRNNAARLMEFSKDANGVVLKKLKETSSKVLAMEISNVERANPNIELLPEANRKMLAQGIGEAKWQDDYYKALSAWYRNGNSYATGTDEFDIKWVKEHPLQEYINKEEKVIFAKGSENPPEKNTQNIPASLMDVWNSQKLQRKGDLFRNKETGQVYGLDGKEIVQ